MTKGLWCVLFLRLDQSCIFDSLPLQSVKRRAPKGAHANKPMISRLISALFSHLTIG